MSEEVNKDILISKVLAKNLIWDKRLKAHSNRKAVDKAWQDISMDMGIQDDLLRKKWKYLRDQFAHEMGRIQLARLDGGSTGKNIESQWAYFNSLMFLKGIIKPRTTLATLMKKKKTQLELEPEAKYKVDLAENEEASSESSDEIEEDVVLEETNDHQDIGLFMKASDDATTTSFKLTQFENSQRKRKQNEFNVKYNQKVIVLEEKKRKLLELEEIINEKSRNENEDLLFFRSLLPHVEKIPDNIKLRFRSRVQQLVEEFAYPQTPTQIGIGGPAFSAVTQNKSMPPSYSICTLSNTREDQHVEDVEFENVKNEF